MLGFRLIRAFPLLLMLSLASCGTSGSADPCAGFKPIIVDKLDVLTRSTLEAIVAHDELGAKKCGWKPPH